MAETDVLDGATIGDLRSLAKSYGIKAERSWDRARFVEEIVKAQAAGVAPDFTSVDDEDNEAERLIAEYSTRTASNGTVPTGAPKPGFARVIVHRDPTPEHSNSPIPVGLNGRMFMVPRGVPVDLPIPYLGVLKDASQHVVRQSKEPTPSNPEGVVVEEDILSYPFQIISLTPGGKFVNNLDQRSTNAQRRKAFHSELGRWPTEGELREWEKEKLADKRKAN